MELTILLLIYSIYGKANKGLVPYILVTFSMWFLVVSWLFGPFLFNPSGFDWQKIVEDWDDWNQWMKIRGGIGVPSSKSWESWWNEEQEHLKYTGFLGRFLEVILSLRFFLYQYGLIYKLNIVDGNKQIQARNSVPEYIQFFIIKISVFLFLFCCRCMEHHGW
jgi:callose synthase